MEELCWMCNLNKIEMIMRPLCRSCYKTATKEDMLFMFPIQGTAEKTKDGLVKKYGPQILVDIESLKHSLVTLREIGDRFGLTRERIRQIYKRIYDIEYTEVVNKRKGIRTEAHSSERLLRSQIENKLKRIKTDSACFKGVMAEFLFYKKCDLLGYDVALRGFGKHIYDADVNGLKVEIKSCHSHKKMHPKSNQTYYHINPKQKQLNIVDFLAIFIAPENFWYILPKREFTKADSIYIPFDEKFGNGRYQYLQQYRNAWELLKSNENKK